MEAVEWVAAGLLLCFTSADLAAFKAPTCFKTVVGEIDKEVEVTVEGRITS